MAAALLAVPRLEHLTPHDLVTYYRCPHELELVHAQRAALRTGTEVRTVTPPDVVPLHRPALPVPPHLDARVWDGRFDVFPADQLVYEDLDEEDELPMLFADNQRRPDPRFHAHGRNLVDEALGLSGRPDYVVRRGDGRFAPIEYKSTHPVHGLHATHGRAFDVIQVLAECRLVAATTGALPRQGYLLYGDTAGHGAHEGWVEIPYGPDEDRWVSEAAETIRRDHTRAPLPSERTCATCRPHGDGLCPFAAVRYDPGRA